jgi:ADP-heptose:LPS heptosyltransferase
VLLGRPLAAELFEHRPGPVDRVVVVPPSHGVREESGRPPDAAVLEAFLAAMGAERFDLALQMHGGGRWSNPFVTRLGAARTAGSRAPDAEPLDTSLHYARDQSEIVRALEVVGLVGAAPVGFEPRLEVTARDLEEARTHTPADGYAVLHPGAVDARRRWPAEHFARLGDELVGTGLEVVVTGAPDEASTVAEVVGRMRARARDLCGALTLGGLAGTLSRAALVVANDTGPLHLAAAVGAPTVGLYWWPNVITSAPLTRRRHRVLISNRHACPVCGAELLAGACAHDASSIADIEVAAVIAAARSLR